MSNDGKTDPVAKELREALTRVKTHLRVTKVVCTRSVKGRSGDHYVGFSAAWDSIQDDAGGAADLGSTSSDTDLTRSAHIGGMSLKDGRLAGLVLGMQADLAAHDHAMAGSNITVEQRAEAIKTIRHNYYRLMTELMKGNGTENGGS